MAHNEHYKHIPKEFQPETFGNVIPLPYSLQDILKRLVRLETKGEKLKDCEKIINNWNVFKESFKESNIHTEYKLTVKQILYFYDFLKEYETNYKVSDICRDYVNALFSALTSPFVMRVNGNKIVKGIAYDFNFFMETKLIPKIKEILTIETKYTNL